MIKTVLNLVIVVLPLVGAEWPQLMIMICLFGTFLMAVERGLSHVNNISFLYHFLPVASI